jgi:hypothetical protein
MTTDTPPPADETRPHTTEPAEGGESRDDAPDVRLHPTEPAEGGDPEA